MNYTHGEKRRKWEHAYLAVLEQRVFSCENTDDTSFFLNSLFCQFSTCTEVSRRTPANFTGEMLYDMKRLTNGIFLRWFLAGTLLNLCATSVVVGRAVVDVDKELHSVQVSNHILSV